MSLILRLGDGSRAEANFGGAFAAQPKIAAYGTVMGHPRLAFS